MTPEPTNQGCGGSGIVTRPYTGGKSGYPCPGCPDCEPMTTPESSIKRAAYGHHSIQHCVDVDAQLAQAEKELATANFERDRQAELKHAAEKRVAELEKRLRHLCEVVDAFGRGPGLDTDPAFYVVEQVAKEARAALSPDKENL